MPPSVCSRRSGVPPSSPGIRPHGGGAFPTAWALRQMVCRRSSLSCHRSPSTACRFAVQPQRGSRPPGGDCSPMHRPPRCLNGSRPIFIPASKDRSKHRSNVISLLHRASASSRLRVRPPPKPTYDPCKEHRQPIARHAYHNTRWPDVNPNVSIMPPIVHQHRPPPGRHPTCRSSTTAKRARAVPV